MSVAHSSAHAEHQYNETFARPAIALDEDSKIDTKEQANLSAEQLDYLRVDDAELVGGLTFNQLSLFEKKSVLINKEMDTLNEGCFWGLGRYQWCIFFLCGFGYFLDLMWAQIFGLVSGQLKQEMGVPNARIGDLSACFSAGLTVGAFFWGLAVDIIGRKWAFNLSCLIASVFGLILAAPENYAAFCAIAFFIGFGVGGNIPIDALICLEFLPTRRRFLLCALSTFQPLGVVTACLISWGTVPQYACNVKYPACHTGITPCCTKASNMGWRYAILIVGSMTLTIFFLRFAVFTFHESPKFLLAKGDDAGAIEVLNKIAKFNKVAPPKLTVADFALLDAHHASESSQNSEDAIIGGGRRMNRKELTKSRIQQFTGAFKHLKILFSTKRRIWLTASLWIAYMSLFFAFSIAGGYLPLILREKGVNLSKTLNETYRNYVIIYLPGVTATILGSFLMEIPVLGRKWAMVVSALIMGTSLFLFAVTDSLWAYVGFDLLRYWAQSLYAALLYGTTPEFFDSRVRGSGGGLASTLGRLASTVAPVAAGTIFNPNSNSVLYLAGGAAFVSAVAISTLPYDTRGKHTF